MRILYHHRTQGEEPESVHIAAIVTALRRLGHEVDVVGTARDNTSGCQSGPSVVGQIKRRTPRLLIELAQIGFNAISSVKLWRALFRARYDFIYERYALYNWAGLLAARVFGIPFVLEVNTLYAQAWSKYYGLTFRRFARLLERYTFRRADAIVTVTAVQRAMLEKEGVRGTRIAVSHNGIDSAEFDPAQFLNSNLRDRLGLPPIVAGFVGTMNRWQGVQGFAEVVRLVGARRSDVGFLFVGDGEGRALLEAELERFGMSKAAFFVGRQHHAAIPEFIAAMDIGLLLDSNAYGSPMKIFEYWAMGKAVVAPAVPPVLEVLRDGETGLLVAPGDAKGMARHILELADNSHSRELLGEAGRRYVLSTHTWDQNAATILQILESQHFKRTDCLKENTR
jgi:glycosyltransferase involved in cell wall biosynthesis